MASDAFASATSIQLSTDKHSFPPWLAELKAQAITVGAWSQIDPDGPDAPHTASVEPKLPMSIDELIEVENKVRRQVLEDWAADVSEQKGPRPIQTVARFVDVKEEHTYRLREYQVQHSRWSTSNTRYQALWTWVRQTVPLMMREPLQEQLILSGKLSLQNLIRALQLRYALTEEATQEHVRNQYFKVLAVAKLGSVAPLEWLSNWFLAYSRVEAKQLPELKGFQLKKDFLEAVEEKLAPEWASEQLRKANEANTMGEQTRSLEEYARILQAHFYRVIDSKTSVSSVYATLGGRPDAPSTTPPTAPQPCPCLEVGERLHRWPPAVCSRVELALTGKSPSHPSTELTDAQKVALQQRLKLPEFAKLVEKLQKKGWLAVGSTTPAIMYPGHVNA